MVLQKIAISIMLLAVWVTTSVCLLAQTADLSSLTDENSSAQSENEQRGRIESTQDEQGMIGPNAENVREVVRELQGLERQRRNLDMSVENLNERRSSRRRTSRRNPPPPVHVQLRPMFPFPRLVAAQVATGVQSHLALLLENRNAGSISVSVEDRTATLRGTVRSEYERRLLEKLVRIEPGISKVDNFVVVEAPQ